MAQYEFGTGALFGKSLANSSSTPVQFGALQGVTIDTAFSTKELFGRFQFPLAIGRGTGKMTGKADFAQFNAQAFNDLFFGLTAPATGSVRTSVEEAQTVTANIVTVTNNATFLRDLGVIKASDSSPFVRTANAPVGQQYSCNETTGVYTFNASQNAVAVKVSYNYNDASNGKKITLTNQQLGNAPQFIAVFTQTFQSKSLTWVLNACMSSKLGLTTKLEDFAIPSFDFQAFADASNEIGSISMDE